VSSGIVFVNRNGLRWCDAAREYGPHKMLYNRSKRWDERRVILRMMEGAGCRERRAEDDHDRRDLPESTPHGIEPAG
jgi:transposase